MTKSKTSTNALGSPSRRLFLAAGPAAAVFAGLHNKAAAEGSPIAELIERHKAALEAFTEACEREDALSHDKESAAYKQADDDWNRLGEAESDALTALLAHKAANLDEARTKAQYMLETLDFEIIIDDKLDAFLRSFLV